MPYTPPAQLSPAASKSTTPVPSRSPSYLKGYPTQEPSSPANERPSLPRSTGSSSYLSRQRRSPTVTTNNDRFGPMTDSQRAVLFDPHGSVRQSPPPVTNGLIPTGMTISPPDSSQNSDDEEIRGRSRELENLEELQAAISQINLRSKSGSPQREEQPQQTQSAPTTPSSVDTPISANADTRPPLSREARKISHSRSSTDSNIIFESPTTIRLQPPSPFDRRDSTDSADSQDEDLPSNRPPMLRKKSGELVRPALRPASRRRPSSMPGTPTYSKAVHFDSHLEHVRHFLQVDRPLAVSAGSSPVEAYESENEFPFGSDENGARSRGPTYEWDIKLANFPAETLERKALPVYVERVFLSSDKKNLIGSVAVQNLAFQKLVVARFTLDYWKTTSEVIADFNNDVRRKQQNADNLDRFNFSIRLADQANLENKTLFFCIRYNVNGQDYWDNNSGYNYQVDFTKKARTSSRPQQPSGLGARPINSLPRSRPSPPVSSGRSPTLPNVNAAFDDFATSFDNFGLPLGQAPGVIIGEPKIKLRSPRSKAELINGAPMRRNKSTPMFGHRYDFNSSLSAAKNSAYAALGDQSGLTLRIDAKQSSRDVPAVAASKSEAAPQQPENGVRNVSAESSPVSAETHLTMKPAAALVSEKPPLSSQSYQELVDKYCFFGTANKSPQLNRSALSFMDGANDDNSSLSGGSGRSSGTSTPVANGFNSPISVLSSLESFSNTRSTSPLPRTGSCVSSRSASPAPFGYHFPHTSAQQTLMNERPTATAIHG